MAWYDRFIGRTAVVDEEKENPSQYLIARDEGFDIGSREVVTNYRNAYEQLEVVNRAVNMIVDDAADIPFDVGEPVQGVNNIIKNIKSKNKTIVKNRIGSTKKAKKEIKYEFSVNLKEGLRKTIEWKDKLDT